MVVGGDSCAQGHGFESQHRVLDGYFFSLVEIVLFVWKDENKRNRGRGWPLNLKERTAGTAAYLISKYFCSKIYVDRPTQIWTSLIDTDATARTRWCNDAKESNNCQFSSRPETLESIYSFAQKSLEDTFTSSFKRKQFLQFWPQQHEDDDDRCDAPIRLKKGLASMTCVSPLHSLSLSLILSHSHTLLSQTVLASLSFSLIDTF